MLLIQSAVALPAFVISSANSSGTRVRVPERIGRAWCGGIMPCMAGGGSFRAADGVRRGLDLTYY